jgi:membrane-bound ClpP family serine protease
MHQGVKTGQEAMLKKKALVIEDIDPEGKIQYANEIWDAKGEGKRFLKGEQVLIKEFSGLSLIVDEMPFEKDTI